MSLIGVEPTIDVGLIITMFEHGFMEAPFESDHSNKDLLLRFQNKSYPPSEIGEVLMNVTDIILQRNPVFGVRRAFEHMSKVFAERSTEVAQKILSLEDLTRLGYMVHPEVMPDENEEPFHRLMMGYFLWDRCQRILDRLSELGGNCRCYNRRREMVFLWATWGDGIEADSHEDECAEIDAWNKEASIWVHDEKTWLNMRAKARSRKVINAG